MRYLLLLLILSHTAAYAELDADHRHALKQTKDMLNNPSERQKAIAKDPKAKEMDDKVGALAGTSQNKDEIYGIAAQLMEKIAQETNGDPEKMQLLMLEAQKNPEAFYKKYFNEEQKSKVRDVATKIQGNPPKAAGRK